MQINVNTCRPISMQKITNVQVFNIRSIVCANGFMTFTSDVMKTSTDQQCNKGLLARKLITYINKVMT